MYKENSIKEGLRVNGKKTGMICCFLFFIFFSLSANAQCAMCRAALGGEHNKAQAQAVNDGIVYLMVIPYLLVAGLAYIIYRMRKKRKDT